MFRLKFLAALSAVMLTVTSLPLFSGSALELDSALFADWLQGEENLPNGYAMVGDTGDMGYVLYGAMQGALGEEKQLYYYNSSDPSSKQLITIRHYLVNKVTLNLPDYVVGETDLAPFRKFHIKYSNAIVTGASELRNGSNGDSYLWGQAEKFHGNQTRCSYASCAHFIQLLKNRPELLGTISSAKYRFVDAEANWEQYQGLNFSQFFNKELTEADVKNVMAAYAPDAAFEIRGTEKYPEFCILNIDYTQSANIIRAMRVKFPDHLTYTCVTESLSDPISLQTEEKELLNADLDFTFGDVNRDGAITLTDAYDALMFSSREAVYGWTTMTDNSDIYLESKEFAAADVNFDGEIRLEDAYYILMYASYQALGIQPTWEDILSK